MSISPAKSKILAACLVLCGSVAPATAQTTAAQILGIQPKVNDVQISTPTAEETGACKLEVVKGANGSSGYLLVDGQRRPLRKFFDSDGDGRVDTWSFYKEGTEVYRESAGKTYAFRWIGIGGMKYGVGAIDQAGKARIATWRMISAEEAAQEAFLALATGDFERMKALFITEQEIQALGLPATEAQRLIALQTNAPTKFQQVRGKLPSLPKATFTRLESAQPGAYPADVIGGSQEIVKITRGLILFENASAEKKHDWLPAPEMILVGNAWRLVDVPSPESQEQSNPELAVLLNQLAKVDQEHPAGTGAKVADWNLQRVQLVQKIAAVAKDEDKENWYKQIFDNLASAVVAGNKDAATVMTKWKQHFVTAMPGTNMAAYGAYREIWATYQPLMGSATAAQLPKIQEKYHEDLAKFVQAYPKADDTADALIQLAMGGEFTAKEDEAKKWYAQITANFPNHYNGAKASGAVRRLDSVGKDFELAGPQLGTAQPFNVNALKGKVTVVYYWASYSGQSVGDFATLKKLQETYAKDLSIVTVNLDDQATEPTSFLQKSNIPGAIHLHQQAKEGGGMNSPLATQYGIFGLPHLFLVGQDGKVVNNKIQVGALDEEISKLTKK